MKRLRILLLVFMMSVALGTYKVEATETGLVYPGEKWQTKEPDEVNLDIRKLKELSDYAGGFGCVVRHGYMVYSWGDASRRKDVASAVKPFYTHFLLKAVEDGKIEGIDELIVKYEPGLRALNQKLNFKDRRITWKHLCNQISCYGVREQPGKAFDYSDYNMALFFDTLFLKVYGSTWKTVDRDVLHPKLTSLLQCQDKPTFMAFGPGNRPGRLAISPRDFARFGLLYLRKGKWNNRKLVSAKHVTLAVTSPFPNSIPRTKGKSADMIGGQRSIGGGNNQCDHNGNYSFAWWVNGVARDGKRNWPDVPGDVYGCFGHGDIRAMVVMPSLDLIVCWNDTKIEGNKKANHALKLLKDSITESGPRTGRIVVDPDRPQWLKRKGGGSFFMCGPGDPEDFLYRGKLQPDGTRKGDQMALIGKLKGTGVNSIYLMAVRSHGGDGDNTHNPFVSNDPGKGINPGVLAQWEVWFTQMDKNGIIIYFFLYDDSARIWNTGDRVGKEEKDFIRTIVNRFKHHKNLIWCVAEEYSEALSVKRVKNIAAEIRAADDYGHPIAVHKHSGLDFSEFADDANIDQFAIQYNVPDADTLHEGMVRAWKQSRGRYNLNMSEAANYGTGEQARKKSWACAMGGAYVMILGMDIAATAESDLVDCGHLVRFFESTNFHEMTPHDELGYGSTKYVLAQPGISYIAYTPELKSEIGLKDMFGGTYEFRWFDCASGKQVSQTKIKVSDANHTWSKPPAIGNELAVYIRRVE